MKLVLRELDLPREKKLDSDIEWLCCSLGFFETIDKEKTAAKIFKFLLKNSGEEAKSTEIAKVVGVSRGAVVNHLNRMIESGLIENRGNRYRIRGSTAYSMVMEIKEDVDRVFKKLEKVAWEIDTSLNYPIREFRR